MIEITVKTLDGRNRTFEVDDSITVRQFKETIAPSIEIEADVQRLIYRGKVLVDDNPINDYDVNGKTLHVVQRVPPRVSQSAERETGQSTSRSNNRGRFEMFPLPEGISQGIHIEMIPESIVTNGGTSGGGSSTPQSEARKRINQASRMINMAKDVINGLEQSSEGSTPTEEKMETEEPSTSQEEPRAATQPTQTPTQQADDNSDPSTAALADLLDEVLSLNERMDSHIRRYRDIMRDNESTQTDAQSEEKICKETSRGMHLISHAYHNLSDLFCDFQAPAPRSLKAFSSPMRQATTIIQQTIPVQVSAQFNVSPVMRENTSAAATPATQTTTTPAPQTTSAPQTTTNVPAPTTSSASSPFNFLSEFNRLVGGEAFQFSTQGVNTTSTTTPSQAPPTSGRAFHMVMEMGPHGNLITPQPVATTTGQASPTTTTTAPTTNSGTNPPSQPTTGSFTLPMDSNGSRATNITMSGTGAPGLLNDDFLQNIIQVATGVALQNGGAQRPQFVMLGGPSMAFMGPGGQRAGHQQQQQPPQRRRMARRAEGTSQPTSTAPSGGISANAGVPPSSGGSAVPPPVSGVFGMRADQERRFRDIISDPCLPCNSWHFGHRSINGTSAASAAAGIVNNEEQAQQSANGNTRRPAEGGAEFARLRQAVGSLEDFISNMTGLPNQPPPPNQNQSQQNSQSQGGASSLESLITRMFDITQLSDSSLENILTSIGADADPNGGLLSELIAHLAPHMTFSDLFNLVVGQRSSLRRLRVPLQGFINNCLLHHQPPTEENVSSAVERILGTVESDIREISESVAVTEDDIDFAASLRSILRQHLTDTLKLVINSTDDELFSEQLSSSLSSTMDRVVNMCRFCLRDGDTAVESIVQSRMRSIYSDESQGMSNVMTQWTVQYLQSKLPTIPRSSSSFRDHIIRRSTVAEMDGDSTGSFESASAIDEKMDEDMAPPALHNGQLLGDEPFFTMDGHQPRLNGDVAARLAPPPADDNIDFEAELVKDENNEWKSVVPKEWVPVIAKDAIRQRRQSMDNMRESFSDAYLCGVPAKRRKVMMRDRNSQGQMPGDALLNDLSDSIRQAANQVNSQPITSFQDVRSDLETNHTLLSAYKEELARSSEDSKDKFGDVEK